MFTRQDYLATPNSTAAHRRFYGQFVTPEIERILLNHISLSDLRASTDPHMNDIPLRRWDDLFNLTPSSVWKAIRDAGDVNACSFANNVCLYKEAARQILEKSAP
jgi:hypothetical protein